MNKKICMLLCFAFFAMGAAAQQNQEKENVRIPYAYSQYQDVTLTFIFGSKKKVMGNIYYDGSRLYYLQDSVPMQADLHNIVKAEFPDATYLAIDSTMARLVAEKDGKRLLCVKTIDVKEMMGRDDGMHDKKGEGLPFFQLEGYGIIDLAGTESTNQKTLFPIVRSYYVTFPDGAIVPAKDRYLKKRYTGAKRKQFILFTEDRFWSWNDEASLVKLLDIL